MLNRKDTRHAKKYRVRLSGPVAVGLFFALLAIVLSLVGLGRGHNLSLRNIALAIVLGGGTWGLISWAIATAVVQVDADVAARKDDSTEESSPQPCCSVESAERSSRERRTQ
jgi:hypothetical protein